MIRFHFCAPLASLVWVLASPGVRAESIIETQQRHVITLKQKLVETKARLKEGAPELAELEAQLQAQTKFVEELRASTQEQLRLKLQDIEKELEALRGGQLKADPVREALFEQARGTVLRRLLENQLGFELDKDVPGLPATPADAAAAETIRTGAISFRLPEAATPAAVDQLIRQVGKIAPNVQLTYLSPLRVMTAHGGDSVQLRRVQGLVEAMKDTAQARMANNAGGEPVRPPRLAPEAAEPRKPPKEPEF